MSEWNARSAVAIGGSVSPLSIPRLLGASCGVRSSSISMISSSLDITASRPGPSDVASASIMVSTWVRNSRSPRCPAGRCTTGDSSDASSPALTGSNSKWPATDPGHLLITLARAPVHEQVLVTHLGVCRVEVHGDRCALSAAQEPGLGIGQQEVVTPPQLMLTPSRHLEATGPTDDKPEHDSVQSRKAPLPSVPSDELLPEEGPRMEQPDEMRHRIQLTSCGRSVKNFEL